MCYVGSKPQAGVELELIGDNGLITSATTGTNGAFNFSDVKAGSYVINAKFYKYFVSREVDLTENVNFHFELFLGKPDKQRDNWDKLSIISTFLSSVVIAVIGILISTTIQRTQVKISKANMQAQLRLEQQKTDNAKALQEGQLASELVNHLISEDPLRREIAIIALSQITTNNLYNRIVGVLAKNDTSKNVRIAAIQQLGNSNATSSWGTLLEISNDPKKPPIERDLAKQSTRRIALSSVLTQGSLIYAAAPDKWAVSVDRIGGGLFTYSLLSGLRGGSDYNKDGQISALELGMYIRNEVISYAKDIHINQAPIFFNETGGDPLIIGPKGHYSEVAGVIVGINGYQNLPSLYYSEKDAKAILDFFKQEFGSKNASNLHLLLGSDATRENILHKLELIESRIKRNALVILYYSGHGNIGKNGQAKWVLEKGRFDSEIDSIQFDDIRYILKTFKSALKVIFVDASFGGAGLSSEIK